MPAARRRTPLRRRLQQTVDAVHRLAHEARDEELRERRGHGAEDADQRGARGYRIAMRVMRANTPAPVRVSTNG